MKDNCVCNDINDNISHTPIHHSGNDCQLVLTSCNSVYCADESIVYYHQPLNHTVAISLANVLKLRTPGAWC